MNISRYRSVTLISLVVVVVALFFAQSDQGAFVQGPLEGRTITGTVYFIGGRAGGNALPFRLIINRLTSPEESRRLTAILAEGGQDQLLRTLSKMDAGRIQIGNGVGVVANAIIASPSGDQTKLTVVYERYLRFSELRYGARSQDYKFGYAELYVGAGANKGMLIPAAKIRLKEGGTWEVEDFGTYPAKLMGLQVRGSGRS